VPASPDYFTVTCNGIGSIGIDYVDPNTDPDEDIVYAFVTFRPRLKLGETIWAAGLTPPRGIILDPVKARFAPEDGKLRTIVAGPLNEKQRITITGSPSGGTWPLTFSGQGPTSGIAYNAVPATVQAALESLSNINVGDVYVSGATTNEKQQIAIGGGATAGTLKVAFNGSAFADCGAIPRMASSATMKGLLQAIPTIGSGNCAVVGPAGGPWVIEFTGALAGQNQPPVTVQTTALTGGTPSATVTTPVPGTSGSPYTVTFQGQYAAVDVPLLSSSGASLTPSGGVLIETTQIGTADLGVKLVANTTLIDLDELIYDVEFKVPGQNIDNADDPDTNDNTDNDSTERIIKPFAITAPTTANQTIDLATVTKLPHRSTIAEWA
jgi:hypothetical protein